MAQGFESQVVLSKPGSGTHVATTSIFIFLFGRLIEERGNGRFLWRVCVLVDAKNC